MDNYVNRTQIPIGQPSTPTPHPLPPVPAVPAPPSPQEVLNPLPAPPPAPPISYRPTTPAGSSEPVEVAQAAPAPPQPQNPPDKPETVEGPKQLTTQFLTDTFSSGVKNPPIFVNTIISESVKLGASDILFEPNKEVVTVRVRIDGALYIIGTFSRDLYANITARIKILSKLDTTEKRKVQEGQFSLESDSGPINIRVEIVQTVNDELIVFRILQMSSIVMPLSELGMGQVALNDYIEIIKSRSGLILVCGPTGSGKTTTLYSTITYLNKNGENNVMTIEDPVEYQLQGVNQMPVRVESDFTFAEGLKSILRLSPDIILVGEIRDRETAVIAVESGLTGHMVLSTIHAPDVIGVIYRLLDLGIESYLLNSSLRGVIAQRLVRKICPHCRVQYQPSFDEHDVFRKHLNRQPQMLYRGQGCESCQHLGYQGRIGIYEVLKMDSGMRNLIRQQRSEDDLRSSLESHHFTTLLKDGLQKCEQGITTIEEVFRNSLRID